MKQMLLLIFLFIGFRAGFSQSGNKSGGIAPRISQNAGLPSNVFYLSAYGAISDAETGMNSVTFGTDNTSAIQNVLDKARSAPITVYWDGRYSVTGLIIYSNTTIIA